MKQGISSLGVKWFKTKGSKGPKRYTLPHGQRLSCLVCRGQFFDVHHYKLNTTGMELFDLAWANKDATCLVCATCRHIHWFAL